jgi:hypothetical protein
MMVIAQHPLIVGRSEAKSGTTHLEAGVAADRKGWVAEGLFDGYVQDNELVQICSVQDTSEQLW